MGILRAVENGSRTSTVGSAVKAGVYIFVVGVNSDSRISTWTSSIPFAIRISLQAIATLIPSSAERELVITPIQMITGVEGLPAIPIRIGSKLVYYTPFPNKSSCMAGPILSSQT